MGGRKGDGESKEARAAAAAAQRVVQDTGKGKRAGARKATARSGCQWRICWKYYG